MNVEQIVGVNVRAHREHAGLTLAQLADALGAPWTRQAVWKLEHGQRHVRAREIVAIARALDVTAGDLFTGTWRVEL